MDFNCLNLYPGMTNLIITNRLEIWIHHYKELLNYLKMRGYEICHASMRTQYVALYHNCNIVCIIHDPLSQKSDLQRKMAGFKPDNIYTYYVI